jgi:GNAT superfamily N-acetyltransferase
MIIFNEFNFDNDISEIVKLSKKAFNYQESEEIIINRWIFKKDSLVGITIRDDDKIIGYGVVSIEIDKKLSKGFEVAIGEDYQHQGLSQLLGEKVALLLKEKGIKKFKTLIARDAVTGYKTHIKFGCIEKARPAGFISNGKEMVVLIFDLTKEI